MAKHNNRIAATNAILFPFSAWCTVPFSSFLSRRQPRWLRVHTGKCSPKDLSAANLVGATITPFHETRGPTSRSPSLILTRPRFRFLPGAHTRASIGTPTCTCLLEMDNILGSMFMKPPCNPLVKGLCKGFAILRVSFDSIKEIDGTEVFAEFQTFIYRLYRL